MKQELCNIISNIKNGQLAKRAFIYQKKKKICESFLKILWNEGFIIGYKISFSKPKNLKIFLKYHNNKPVINIIKLISKPGCHIYYTINKIWKINSNKFLVIFSTSKGLKSIVDCKKLKIGGEPFIIIN